MSGSQQLVLAEGAGGAEKVYIEDVFSTWLYTGNGSTQTITNGIDLSTKGGLVWGKDRINAGTSHILIDTNRWSAGANALLYSDLTNSQQGYTQAITAFNTTGFTLGNGVGFGGNNASGTNYASWTFRKQAKFFDVVTWTGNDAGTRSIPHSLGSVPGCVMIKALDSDSGRSNGYWIVNHRSLPSGQSLLLPDTSGAQTLGGYPSPFADSTTFTVTFGTSNTNGVRYVAYLFAHDAGGFGLTGTDNVISCGSYTGNGSSTGPTITLGYEPQWLMIKRATGGSGNWIMYDNMRGMPMPSVEWADLLANSSAAENAASTTDYSALTATGFQIRNALAGVNNSGDTYIYIAIRRGPMKTPTTGTSVFTPDSSSAAGNQTITAGFPTDMLWQKSKPNVGDWYAGTRLQGNAIWLNQNSTAAETNFSSINPTVLVFTNAQNSVSTNLTGSPISYAFRRAPGFFDVVCYTGTGSATTQAHNLGVVPEMMIVKSRSSGTYNWNVYIASASSPRSKYLNLNTTGALGTTTNFWGSSGPTSTTFSLDTWASNNDSGATYVAYLFASCPGVSKVFSFTGNGSSQTINCGFTGGARFVMIKRTDSTGDWYVWDTARGIVANNDPHLSLNSTAAEVTTNDTIDTDSTGFVVNQVSATNVNVNGASYIGLAIA